MPKKTIDEKIDELAVIATNGFRRVEGRLSVLETDVAELKEDSSWMRHAIELMALDIEEIKSRWMILN